MNAYFKEFKREVIEQSHWDMESFSLDIGHPPHLLSHLNHPPHSPPKLPDQITILALANSTPPTLSLTQKTHLLCSRPADLSSASPCHNLALLCGFQKRYSMFAESGLFCGLGSVRTELGVV